MLARISTRNLSYEKARKRKAILRHTVDCSYWVSGMDDFGIDLAVIHATLSLLTTFALLTAMTWTLDKLFK